MPPRTPPQTPTPPPSLLRDIRRTAALAAGVLPLLLAAGCNLPPEAQNAQSIIPVFFVGPPSPKQAAEWFFDPYDADKRFRGTLLLANAPFGGEDVYLRGYLDHLNDDKEDPRVRAAAAFALGMHGSPEHVPKMLPLLKNDDRAVRLQVVRALQRLHNPEAVGPLLDTLDEAREPEADVRAEAADALGQYPEDRVLQKLIAALADRHLTVNRCALASLHTLTGEDFSDDRRAWFNWASHTSDPFARRSPYVYPVYSRSRTWIEYIPFVPGPPNETAAEPAGAPAVPAPTDPAAGRPSP